MRCQIVIANWKMNGSSGFVQDMAAALNDATELDAADRVVICPPAIYLHLLGQLLSGGTVETGGQNLSDFDQGAYTGEISAQMLVDVGCKWVLVGHSERRQFYGETDEWIARKARKALEAGLNTVICVGETLDQRKAGDAGKTVSSQLEWLIKDESLTHYVDQLVIAYEPVWAIGTGETATPSQAQEMHALIRSLLPPALSDTPILYGGSVKPDNAAELFAEQDIDGGLVGGASLNKADFVSICRSIPKN